MGDYQEEKEREPSSGTKLHKSRQLRLKRHGSTSRKLILGNKRDDSIKEIIDNLKA